MNSIEKYNENIFEKIKYIDEYGKEYWEARELQVILEYTEWRKFEGVIKRAKKACEFSKKAINNHFVDTDKMVQTGDSRRQIKNYRLSRYACYLIVQNGDSRKKTIALGQTYFAVQTRKQELTEKEYSLLTEEEKRFYNRSLTRKGNHALNQIAMQAGVKNFDKFHNEGYKGLYNGETADDIAKRKRLRYREDILDNMGSSELVANIFRIDMAEQKIRKEHIEGENNVNKAHYKVGRIVRNAIKRASGTMPEELPTPKKSLKELEKKQKNLNIKIKN